MLLCKIASTPSITEITLKEGTVVEFNPFYLLPVNRPGFSADFKRNAGDKRPELGEWGGPDKRWKRDHWALLFKKPGASLLFKISFNGSPEVLYQATPVAALGGNSVMRRIVPAFDPPEPDMIPWFYDAPAEKLMPMGGNKVQIKVYYVAPEIRGETIKLVMSAPLGFKSTQVEYNFLWYFFFIPWVMYPICAIWGISIIWQNFRKY